MTTASSLTAPFDAPAAGTSLPAEAHAPPRGTTRLSSAVTGISIVLPCFNEADNVALAIRAAVEAGARCATDYEVIVVDDGSSDETAAIVAGIVSVDRHVRLLVHARNRGYGAALRAGVEAATMDWLFLTDADLQFDLRELEDFLPHTRRADMIVGWRILRQDPLNRRINAAAWNWLVCRVFQLPVRDVDCAFKLIRRELVRGCDLTSTGAMISTELLVKALARGARMEQIGVHHRPRAAGESSGADPRVILKAFHELAALRRNLPPRRSITTG